MNANPWIDRDWFEYEGPMHDGGFPKRRVPNPVPFVALAWALLIALL